MSVALNEFTTLMGSQGPAWASSQESLINELDTQRFTFSRIKSGAMIEDMVQGGTEITDRILRDFVSTTRWINPAEKIDYTNQQTGENWTLPWAYQVSDTSWTAQELDHNAELQGKYRAQKYKDVMRQKHQVVWSDICEFQEAATWAVPDYNLMEAAQTPAGAPRQAQSLFCLNNEFANGLFPGDYTTNGTIQRLAADAKWAPQRASYNFGAGVATSLPMATAMDTMWERLKFDPLPKMPEYSDKTTTPHVIYTQLEGLTNFKHMLRENQDYFRGAGSGQDPAYPGPTYMGLPVEWLDTLDTVAAYPTVSASSLGAYDAAGTGSAGPRYHFFNFQHVRWVGHANHHFKPSAPKDLPYHVDTYGQQFTNWWNLYAKSMRRSGTLYPAADIVSV
jgi:hypothetical protein